MRGEMFKRKLMTLKVCFEGVFFFTRVGRLSPQKMSRRFLICYFVFSGKFKVFFFRIIFRELFYSRAMEVRAEFRAHWQGQNKKRKGP